MNIADIMNLGTVIPVATITDENQATSLAKQLLADGLPTIEVTLRTDAALPAIRRIRAEVPDIITGAGTIVDLRSYDAAVEAGAQFLVSPGSTDALLSHASKHNIPFLPGASTVSEVMNILSHGFTRMKFFPAALAGGPAMLKNLNALFPQVTFCPTGGISAATMQSYLDLPNVACVGGSWVIS